MLFDTCYAFIVTRMLLRLCTADRVRFVLSAKSLAEFKEKGRQTQLMRIHLCSSIYCILRCIYLLFILLFHELLQYFLILCGSSLFVNTA